MSDDPLARLAHWAIAVAKGELDPDSDPFVDEDVQGPADPADDDDPDDDD